MKDKQIDPEQLILESWQINAQPWIDVLSEGRILSRKLVTDQAIINAVLETGPETVLDIGCGEGWLVRALTETGISATGVDGVAALIQSAEEQAEGRFMQLAYDEISAATITDRFDAIVCNFSLLGGDSVEQLFSEFPGLLNGRGYLIVQTLHPDNFPGPEGWREGTWAGIEGDFNQPAPWYYRTLSSWLSLFTRSGFELISQIAPLHPESGLPASLILVGRYSG